MRKRNSILVVDDEERNVDLIEAILISQGYGCQRALSGMEALAKLDDTTDLVLLDIMMPEMDGFEVARRIRSDGRLGDIPVIMVTGLTGKEDRLKSVEVGANDFISKPIDRLELMVRVTSLLRMKEAQDAIKRHKAELEETVARRTKALRESEERFRTVFEAAQDSIFIKDAALRYTHVNPAMLRILETTREEIVGKTDDDIFDAMTAKSIKNLELRVLDVQSIESEQTLVYKGESITFNWVRVPMVDSSGSVLGLCGIARDITERKKREKEPAKPSEEYRSPAMKATLEQVRLAAKTDSIVLFLGESGAGKDYLATYLHSQSRRAGGPFFSINCAALAPELAESELFGHEAGAFTGSRGRKRGLLELAEGGTLLLNEIGELHPRLQAKLLTFLDTQSFTRVGGEKNVTVNARLMAATNRDLEKEVEGGNFRKDLYYRLNVFSIVVPPLRNRLEDLAQLMEELLGSLTRKMGLHDVPLVEPEALKALSGYDWPGNIRELRNVVERALIRSNKERITEKDFGFMHNMEPGASPAGGPSFSIVISDGVAMGEILDRAKRWMISEALHRSGGSVKGAAERLGISRDQMKYFMKSLDVRRE